VTGVTSRRNVAWLRCQHTASRSEKVSATIFLNERVHWPCWPLRSRLGVRSHSWMPSACRGSATAALSRCVS